jgi:hypothetical protein
MVKALAELGARGNDRGMLDILAAQGLSVTVGGPPTAPAGAVASSGAARK